MRPVPRALTRVQAARIRALLQEKQARAEENVFVVEGAKAVCDLLARTPQPIESLVLSPAYLQREEAPDRHLRLRAHVREYTCSDVMFAKLSDVHMPQGMLAVVKRPQWDERRVLAQSSLLGIFGERIQDPANVGTIIRTAAAFNLAALWLSPDSADVYSPKVVRCTSGTLLSLPIFRAKDVTELARSGCAIYAAVASNQGTVPIQDVRQTPRKLILAVGNESRGLSLAMRKAADLRFTIPLSHQVESLNVAATVAIAAFYFSRLPKEES